MVTPFRIGWLILSTGLFVLLGYGVARAEFTTLITLYGLVFWGYSRVMQPYWTYATRITDTAREARTPDRFLFGAALLFRLVLLAATPTLSDDYARFIWDGRLLVHGYNPYLHLPSQLINTPIATAAGLPDALYSALNSPDYFTVYPPLNQLLFGLAGWFSPGSLTGAIIALRVPIILTEVGVMWLMVKLLHRFNQNPNLALLYGLNPLVILELTGNVHYEGVMVFFVLLAVWLLGQKRWISSSVVLALGVCTKLLPLLFLPLLIRYLDWKRGLMYAVLTLMVTAVLFLPFFSLELMRNVFSSLDLYFQKFEFNASVYYLIRAVGYWVFNFNIITGAGIGLFIGIIAGVLFIAFRLSPAQTGPDFPVRLLLTLSFYWLLSTTVHPWYITTLIAAAVFTPFRYPLLWSGMVMLSYAAYQTQPYHENYWLTGLEYGVVLGVGIYEWLRVRRMALQV